MTLHFTCIDLPEGNYYVIVSTFPNFARGLRSLGVRRENCKCDLLLQLTHKQHFDVEKFTSVLEELRVKRFAVTQNKIR